MAKINVADLPEFDPAEFIDDDESIVAYLNGVMEANNISLLASAFGDIARARGMSQIVEKSGITREALYKSLRPDAEPRFETISRVCRALGLKLNLTAA